MKLPFLLRSRHDALIAELQGRLDLAVFRAAQADEQAVYWRRRAELFLDRATARVGITHEPVMREGGEQRNNAVDPMLANAFSGMGMDAFDSTKVDGKPDADWRRRMHVDQAPTQERES